MMSRPPIFSIVTCSVSGKFVIYIEPGTFNICMESLCEIFTIEILKPEINSCISVARTEAIVNNLILRSRQRQICTFISHTASRSIIPTITLVITRIPPELIGRRPVELLRIETLGILV